MRLKLILCHDIQGSEDYVFSLHCFESTGLIIWRETWQATLRERSSPFLESVTTALALIIVNTLEMEKKGESFKKVKDNAPYIEYCGQLWV